MTHLATDSFVAQHKSRFRNGALARWGLCLAFAVQKDTESASRRNAPAFSGDRGEGFRSRKTRDENVVRSDQSLIFVDESFLGVAGICKAAAYFSIGLEDLLNVLERGLLRVFLSHVRERLDACQYPIEILLVLLALVLHFRRHFIAHVNGTLSCNCPCATNDRACLSEGIVALEQVQLNLGSPREPNKIRAIALCRVEPKCRTVGRQETSDLIPGDFFGSDLWSKCALQERDVEESLVSDEKV